MHLIATVVIKAKSHYAHSVCTVLRQDKRKWFSQGHTDGQWKNHDFNLSSMGPEPLLLTIPLSWFHRIPWRTHWDNTGKVIQWALSCCYFLFIGLLSRENLKCVLKCWWGRRVIYYWPSEVGRKNLNKSFFFFCFLFQVQILPATRGTLMF